MNGRYVRYDSEMIPAFVVLLKSAVDARPPNTIQFVDVLAFLFSETQFCSYARL